jgi:putative DNA primase/helicase
MSASGLHDENFGVTRVTGVTPTPPVTSSGYTEEKSGATGVTNAANLIPESRLEDVKRPCWLVLNHDTKDANGKTYKAGTWWMKTERVEGKEVPADARICGPLHVNAITSNHDKSADYGRLLLFKNLDGKWIKWAMPAELLAGRNDPILAELLNQGLQVEHAHRATVCRYLAEQSPTKRVTAATATGWNGPALFILPRLNIGKGDAVYQSESATGDDYGTAGTLDGWREGVGARCPGNPLLLLSVCTALAGPLLDLVRRSGGGFHLYGKSSTGKTSAIDAACSCWGNPEEYKRTWRATSNGLEGVAAQRNDTLLALDEMGESDPREAGAIVYALANGAGKTRANRIGSARKAKRWRIMLLSSGEIRLATHMQEGGKKAKAGQEIRLLDIPVTRNHGAWDQLHGLPDGRSFSDAIQKATRTHYGHAGPAFVRHLIESGEADQLSATLAAMIEKFPADGGQQSRAAERFALVALAGELAIRWELITAIDTVATSPAEALHRLRLAWGEKLHQVWDADDWLIWERNQPSTLEQ